MKRIVSIITIIVAMLVLSVSSVFAKDYCIEKVDFTYVNYIGVEYLTADEAKQILADKSFEATVGTTVGYDSDDYFDNISCLVCKTENCWVDAEEITLTFDDFADQAFFEENVYVIGKARHYHNIPIYDFDGAIQYSLFDSSVANIPSGNYVLDKDTKLMNDLYIQYGNTVSICLNGYVLDLNGHSISNGGTLELVDDSCVEQYYTINNTTGLFELYKGDDKSDKDKLIGGIITDTSKARCDFYVKNGNKLSIENVGFVGFDIDSQSYAETSILKNGNSSKLSLKNVSFVGNIASKNVMTFCFENTGDVEAYDCLFKNNNLSGGVVVYNNSKMLLKDTIITNNITMLSGLYAFDKSDDDYCDLTFDGDVIIDGNKTYSGDDSNLYLDACHDLVKLGANFDSSDKFDSSISISYSAPIKAGESKDVINLGTNSLKDSWFKSDSKNYYINKNLNKISLKNRIKADVSNLNNTFLLEVEGLSKDGLEASYKWYKTQSELILHNPDLALDKQNYKGTSFIALNTSCKSYYGYDGYWYKDNSENLGLDVELKKGDILKICVEPIGCDKSDIYTYLVDGDSRTILPEYVVYGDDASFQIHNDGIYGIVLSNSSGSAKISVTKIVTTEAIDDNDNTLSTNIPGQYLCKATLTKNTIPFTVLASDVTTVDGFDVKYILLDDLGNTVDAYVKPTLYLSGGTKITKPDNPVGYVVDKWYTDISLASQYEWDFDNDLVESDLVLYGKANVALKIRGSLDFSVKEASDDCSLVIGEGIDALTISNLSSFTVDDTQVDIQYLTIENGCIKITIDKEYLNTLAVGNHKVKVVLSGLLTKPKLDIDGLVLEGTIVVRNRKHNKYIVVNTGIN